MYLEDKRSYSLLFVLFPTISLLSALAYYFAITISPIYYKKSVIRHLVLSPITLGPVFSNIISLGPNSTLTLVSGPSTAIPLYKNFFWEFLATYINKVWDLAPTKKARVKTLNKLLKVKNSSLYYSTWNIEYN